MFRQMLYTQWKWSRTELFFCVVLAFLVPTMIIRIGYTAVDVYAVSSVLSIMGFAGVFFGSLAVVTAFSLAWRPWVVDAALRHVGPLSLPVAWPAFVRMRFLAGAALLLVPTLAVWIGGILATTTTPIPPTLHAYPGGVALRFLVASFVAYAGGFFLQYVAGKHAVKVAVALVIGIALMELAANLLGYESVAVRFWNVLTNWPGPLAVFNVRWMLIDV